MKRFLRTLLKSFTVSRATNKPLFISASRQVPIIPREGSESQLFVAPSEGVSGIMHICRAGNGKHRGKQKKKVNVRKNLLFSMFLKGAPLLRCNSSKQILLIFLQHLLLPGRIKPITMGKSCPNTWLHKVQDLGQTWGRIIPDPIHHSSQT